VQAVQSAPTAALDAVTLYRILQLRVDVFVVEQRCAYRELDGRDLEPGTRQLWVASEGSVLATLRVLAEPDGAARVGRVATAAAARGRGLAGSLMAAALPAAGDADVVLDAQTYLAAWYERLGFTADGPEFVEDGIPHVPMRLRRG
jgi:ElaA protein